MKHSLTRQEFDKLIEEGCYEVMNASEWNMSLLTKSVTQDNIQDFKKVSVWEEDVMGLTQNNYYIRQSDELMKARGVKYFKREPKAGGGYKYYYTEEEYRQKKDITDQKNLSRPEEYSKKTDSELEKLLKDDDRSVVIFAMKELTARNRDKMADKREGGEKKPLIASDPKDLNWQKSPYGGEVAKYKTGTIMRGKNSKGEATYSVEIGQGNKTALVQNASSLEDAIKKIDNKGFVKQETSGEKKEDMSDAQKRFIGDVTSGKTNLKEMAEGDKSEKKEEMPDGDKMDKELDKVYAYIEKLSKTKTRDEILNISKKIAPKSTTPSDDKESLLEHIEDVLISRV